MLLAAVVTAGAPGWGTYRIKSGDTVSEIAKRYGTTVATLVQANHLPGNGHRIYAGETLRVPVSSAGRRAGTTGRATTASTARRTVMIRHRVVAGDSLYKIARKYGVSPALIASTNRLPGSMIVVLGETLRIPVQRTVRTAAASGGNTFLGRTYPDRVVASAAVNRAKLRARAQPSRSRVRAMIVSIARRNGVDPRLALAIAWQESGWDHRRVSVANAIGVMQVLPSTGEWMSQVTGRRLNLLHARDNITAGVVLLRVLTASAPLREAIAGYYQGLASVKRNGMYADTRRYVDNVLALRGTF
jgi:LysM repeat protein